MGTALANVIARAGRSVLLATRSRAGADVLVERRESPRLPGLKLDERIGIAPAGAEVGRYGAVLLAVPSQHLRAAARVIAPSLRPGTPVVACAKGIERGTQKLHDRGDYAEPARRCCGNPLRPELRAGRGARAADRGDAGHAEEEVASALANALGSPPSGSIIRPTCAAWRSAVRQRTCSPLPPAWSPAAASARAPPRRW